MQRKEGNLLNWFPSMHALQVLKSEPFPGPSDGRGDGDSSPQHREKTSVGWGQQFSGLTQPVLIFHLCLLWSVAFCLLAGSLHHFITP